MNDHAIADDFGYADRALLQAGNSTGHPDVHRHVLPRVAPSNGRDRQVRAVRDGARVPKVRLTRRGKVVVGIVWFLSVWTLAEVIPYWGANY